MDSWKARRPELTLPCSALLRAHGQGAGRVRSRVPRGRAEHAAPVSRFTFPAGRVVEGVSVWPGTVLLLYRRRPWKQGRPSRTRSHTPPAIIHGEQKAEEPSPTRSPKNLSDGRPVGRWLPVPAATHLGGWSPRCDGASRRRSRGRFLALQHAGAAHFDSGGSLFWPATDPRDPFFCGRGLTYSVAGVRAGISVPVCHLARETVPPVRSCALAVCGRRSSPVLTASLPLLERT
ncbi:unnamed protein product [Amoebophrya sp. A120]|nr:unnamed protein product [Amoebophrya sp. A120]|eukprot:GSA120T00016133001.1